MALTDLFGDLSASEMATKAAELVDTIENGPSTVNGQRAVGNVGLSNGQGFTLSKVESPRQMLEKQFGALDAGQLAAIEGALGGDFLQKDLTPTSPLASGYVAFDLEAPAKVLVPKPTPLRNMIPRRKGVGLAHRWKRITGFSGSGTGGVGVVHPGFTDSTQTSFANPGSANSDFYNRPRKISYAGDETIIPYVQMGLSDQLSWFTQFTSMGFQDQRAISRASTLYASMLAEERVMLYGRGTLTGFSGVLPAPTGTPTGAARAAGAGEVGVSGATTNIFVRVVAESGDYGVSQAGTVSAAIAVTNGQVVDVTIPAPVTGATGYRVFISTGASDPGDASRFLYRGYTYPNAKGLGRSSTLNLTIQGALPTTGSTIAAYISPSDGSSINLNAADGQSARADSYDGIIPWIMRYGQVNAVNGPFSTANPGVEFQQVFGSLYDSVKGDPDMAWMNGSDRKQISDALKGQTSSNYRITIPNDTSGNVKLGDVVTAVQNEVTGKIVDMMVHPWMPQGIVPIISNTIPIPDSGVDTNFSLFNIQDYMAIDWPVIQMSYDTSVYWAGAMACYAPEWNAVLTGLTPS